MLTQADYWMVNELRQQGVYRGDMAERLGVHPGTASQRSVSGRLAHGPTRRSPVCANLAPPKTPPDTSCGSSCRAGCS